MSSRTKKAKLKRRKRVARERPSPGPTEEQRKGTTREYVLAHLEAAKASEALVEALRRLRSATDEVGFAGGPDAMPHASHLIPDNFQSIADDLAGYHWEAGRMFEALAVGTTPIAAQAFLGDRLAAFGPDGDIRKGTPPELARRMADHFWRNAVVRPLTAVGIEPPPCPWAQADAAAVA